MDRLSLQDIAAYMTDFAAMLDGVEVHFHRISRGSLSVQGRVRREEEQAVIERAYLLRINEAPESAARARESISRRMGVHRAKRASILNSRSEK